ncbi:MAG: hypothetical protein QHD01_29260 [Bradyrhizobium sp.]|uniref:hypothetical protein n=1 Tax=Bradyrhizobium sp. TaxID=376 RepID=UPI0029B6E815|nr:hypothetical protein [Bradyrhizobium sp.]MDX3970658.1 hypothetical protein [Bradyrhizobium sp.]
MSDPIDWLSKNWTVLASAPWIFAGLAVIASTAGYIIGTYFKNGEIAILERRVTDYESKLKVGSPDEAKSKLDRLEGELSGLNKVLSVTVGSWWAPLTTQEIADLSGKLIALPKHRVQLMYLNQLGKPLAETIYQAFMKAGWDGATLSDGGGNHLGIIAGPGREKATAIKNAIESVTRLKVSVDKPDKPEIPDLVYLFVGINAPAEH